MAFIAREVALELIVALRDVVAELRKHDPSLADQIRRAASSAPLNLEEGSQRAGKDRINIFRYAAGSAAEVKIALRVVVAWGYLPEARLEESMRLADRLVGLVWGLVRGR